MIRSVTQSPPRDADDGNGDDNGRGHRPFILTSPRPRPRHDDGNVNDHIAQPYGLI
jgi:hypothetical protein